MIPEMLLPGKIEVAFVNPEHCAIVDWSALNLVISGLAQHGFRPPSGGLEDDHGNIRTPLGPADISELTEHLVMHSEEIARESDSPAWRERVKTFANSRETVTFVLAAVRKFRDCVGQGQQLIVEEMPVDVIYITPQSIEEPR